MFAYIIKRVLMMIPTLALISLVIFGVLNLAPGKPGGTQGSSDGTENSESTEARESYRLFKEQFNFDKPIFFNNRFSLTKDQVQARIHTVVDFKRPNCTAEKQVSGCINKEDKPAIAELLESEDIIEDWGNYIVPHLMDIAQNGKDIEVRKMAINRLTVNSKRRLFHEFNSDNTPEEVKKNEAIAEENAEFSRWGVGRDADETKVNAIFTEKWLPWFEANKERYNYSGVDKIGIFFTDTRFGKYMSNLAHLDFGVSHVDKRPVMTKILEKLPYTLTLNFLAIFFAYLVSIPLGVWSAYRQNTTADLVVSFVLFLLYSLPSFFVAVLFLEYLTIGDHMFDIFPTGDFVGKFPGWYDATGIDSTEDMTTLQYLGSASYHLILPIICLTYGAFASLSRFARTGLLDVIRADYIRTARAKGLSETMIVLKHAVRNGMIPILTLIGMLLPSLIGGSVILEIIFNIPGLGQFLFESIFALDYNSIMGVLLSSALLTLIGLLISDISYAIVDPRISFD